jgi:hypothetical protein
MLSRTIFWGVSGVNTLEITLTADQEAIILIGIKFSENPRG